MDLVEEFNPVSLMEPRAPELAVSLPPKIIILLSFIFVPVFTVVIRRRPPKPKGP